MPTSAPAPASAPETPAAPLRFIGRQPILDPAQKVFGYELLFRTGRENAFPGDPQTIDNQTIDNQTIGDQAIGHPTGGHALFFGLDNLLQPGSKAFIKCDRDALTSRFVTRVPFPNTVLEVPHTIVVDDELRTTCAQLKQLGYAIALDDFLPGATSDRLLDIADYIKLDCRIADLTPLLYLQNHRRGPLLALIATKVETANDLHRARDAGFQYFQGYFFTCPSVPVGPVLPDHRMIYVQLLAAISRSPINPSEIERLISSEASLCTHLLRMANTAGLAARGPISSIRQALLLIGEAKFRKLVTIAAAIGMGSDPGQSPELTQLCLHRARFCELLAPHAGQPPDEQYLIGLLSVIDAMLHLPMPEVLKLLPLRPSTATVLLGQPSPADPPLTLIRHYERSDWESCTAIGTRLRRSEAELTRTYLDALQWATQQIRDSAK